MRICSAIRWPEALVDTGGLKVAQDILGHRHVGTTADIYARVDHQAMAVALSVVKTQWDAARGAGRSPALQQNQPPAGSPGDATGVHPEERYVFLYDATTVEELEHAATPRPPAADYGRDGSVPLAWSKWLLARRRGS